MIDREELIEWINSLESKYPVNSWKIDNVHLWPMIKVRLLINWNKRSINTGNVNEDLSNNNRYVKIIKGFADYMQILRLKSVGGKKVNLYCLAPHFRFFDGEKYVNRYFNTLISEEAINSNFYFLDYGSNSLKYKDQLDFPGKTLFLENIKFYALFLRGLKYKYKKYKKYEFDKFDDFILEVNRVLIKTDISRANILRQYYYVTELKSIYKKILKTLKISNVYILCYYVSEMYAMNLAASELGVISCDIQHGGMGAHVAYSNYNKIPKDGYKLLPKIFWCWDKGSADVISQWATKQNYHVAINKGNPWIEYCKDRYKDSIIESRKIILYTLQPIEDKIIDDYIIEAIKKTPRDYIWWLRLHPRQLIEKDNLVKQLQSHDLLQRVEIENAMKFPLPAILNRCFVHISKYSASILEAYMLKVKSIILTKTGVEFFPEVARSNLAVICLEHDSEKLVDNIISSKGKI